MTAIRAGKTRSFRLVGLIAPINVLSSHNLKKLSDAGVTIATGSDAGNIGTLHASSSLTELLMMQRNDMSNWQIFPASTVNGG